MEEATLVVFVFGLGAAIGGLLGGLIGQRVYNRNPVQLPYFIGACQVAAVFPMVALINSAELAGDSPWIVRASVYSAAFVAGACAACCFCSRGHR